MNCSHKVKWTVRPPEDCCFRLSVSHYKDRIVAPDEYTGATEVTPSDSEQVLATKDKLVRDDIVINPAPTEILSTDHNGTFTPSDGKVGFYQVDVDVQPDLRPLSIDTLTQHGAFLPTGDGFSQVTVEEDWDGILYPVTDETDPLYADKVLNAKHIPVAAGDTVIFEGMGRGRWFGWYRGNRGGPYAGNSVGLSLMSEGFAYVRLILSITINTTLVLAGYEWTNDGAHSANSSYCFFGDYLRWKVIHAS